MPLYRFLFCLFLKRNLNKPLFMFTKCKQTRNLENNSLGLKLLFDTHIDALLSFFKVFSKCKQTILYVYQI
jgi:hypothetical protein